MIKLIRMEHQKVQLTPFLMATMGVTLLALVFGTMFALIGKFQLAAVASDPRLGTAQFMFQMTLLIQCVGFSCMGATLAHRVIASPYSQTELLLTLAYPINRGRMLRAKLFYVGAVTSSLMVVSIVITSVLFIGTNAGLDFIPGTLNGYVLAQIVLMALLDIFATLAIISIGVVAGFTRTSLPISVSAIVLLDSVMGNLLTLSGVTTFVILLAILAVGALLAVMYLNRLVNHLEVL